MQDQPYCSFAAQEKSEVDVPLKVGVKLNPYRHSGFDHLYDKSVVELCNGLSLYSLGRNLVLQKYDVEGAPADHIYLAKPHTYFTRHNKLYLLPNEDSADAVNPRYLEYPSQPMKTTALCAHPLLPMFAVAEVSDDHDHARILLCRTPPHAQPHNMELEPLILGIIYVSLRHKVVVQPHMPSSAPSMSPSSLSSISTSSPPPPPPLSITRACTHITMMRFTRTGIVIVGDGPLWPLWHVDIAWENLSGISELMKPGFPSSGGSKWSQSAMRDLEFGNNDFSVKTSQNAEIELFFVEKPRLLKSPVHSVDVTTPLALSPLTMSTNPSSTATNPITRQQTTTTTTSSFSSSATATTAVPTSTSTASLPPGAPPMPRVCTEQWVLAIACDDGAHICWPTETHIAMATVQIEGGKKASSGKNGTYGIFPEYTRESDFRKVLDRSLNRHRAASLSPRNTDAAASIVDEISSESGKSMGKMLPEEEKQEAGRTKRGGVTRAQDVTTEISRADDVGMNGKSKRDGAVWGVVRARTRTKNAKMQRTFGSLSQGKETPENPDEKASENVISPETESRFFRDGIPASSVDAYGHLVRARIGLGMDADMNARMKMDLMGNPFRNSEVNVDIPNDSDNTDNTASGDDINGDIQTNVRTAAHMHNHMGTSVDAGVGANANVLHPRLLCCWLHSHGPQQMVEVEAAAMDTYPENDISAKKTSNPDSENDSGKLDVGKKPGCSATSSYFPSLSATYPHTVSSSLLSVPARLPLLVIACGPRVLVLGWENIRKNGGLNSGKVNFRVLQAFRTDMLEDGIETVMAMESHGYWTSDSRNIPRNSLFPDHLQDLFPNTAESPVSLVIMGISRSLEAYADDVVKQTRAVAAANTSDEGRGGANPSSDGGGDTAIHGGSHPVDTSTISSSPSIAYSSTSTSTTTPFSYSTPASMCRVLVFTPPHTPPPSRVQRTLDSVQTLRSGNRVKRKTLSSESGTPQRVCVMGIELTLDELEEEEREEEWNNLRNNLPQEKQKSRERGWSRPISATTRTPTSSRSGKNPLLSKFSVSGHGYSENSQNSEFPIGPSVYDPLYLRDVLDVYSPFTQKAMETNFWDQEGEAKDMKHSTAGISTPMNTGKNPSGTSHFRNSQSPDSDVISSSTLPVLPLSFCISSSLSRLTFSSSLPPSLLSFSLAGSSTSTPTIHTITHQPSLVALSPLVALAPLAPLLITTAIHPLATLPRGPSHTQTHMHTQAHATHNTTTTSPSSTVMSTSQASIADCAASIATLTLRHPHTLAPLASLALAYLPLAIASTPDATTIIVAAHNSLYLYSTAANADMRQPLPLSLRLRANIPISAKTTHILCSQGPVQVFIVVTTNFIVTLCPLTLKQYAYLEIPVPMSTIAIHEIYSHIFTTNVQGYAESYTLPFLQKITGTHSTNGDRKAIIDNSEFDEDNMRTPLQSSQKNVVSVTPTHSGIFVVNSETKPLSRYSEFSFTFLPTASSHRPNTGTATGTGTCMSTGVSMVLPAVTPLANTPLPMLASHASLPSACSSSAASAASTAASAVSLSSLASLRPLPLVGNISHIFAESAVIAVIDDDVDKDYQHDENVYARNDKTDSLTTESSCHDKNLLKLTSAMSTCTKIRVPLADNTIVNTLGKLTLSENTKSSSGKMKKSGNHAFPEVTAIGYSSLSLLIPSSSRSALLPSSFTSYSSLILSRISRSLTHTHVYPYFPHPQRPLAPLHGGMSLSSTVFAAYTRSLCSERDVDAVYSGNIGGTHATANTNIHSSGGNNIPRHHGKSTGRKNSERLGEKNPGNSQIPENSNSSVLSTTLSPKSFTRQYTDSDELFVSPYTPTIVVTTVYIGMCEYIVIGTHTGHIALLSPVPPSRESRKKKDMQKKYGVGSTNSDIGSGSVGNLENSNNTDTHSQNSEANADMSDSFNNDTQHEIISSLFIHDTIALSSSPIISLHFLPSLSPLHPPGLLCHTLAGTTHVLTFSVSLSAPYVRTPLQVAADMRRALAQMYRPTVSFTQPHAHPQSHTHAFTHTPAHNTHTTNANIPRSEVSVKGYMQHTHSSALSSPPINTSNINSSTNAKANGDTVAAYSSTIVAANASVISLPLPAHTHVSACVGAVEVGGRVYRGVMGDFDGVNVYNCNGGSAIDTGLRTSGTGTGAVAGTGVGGDVGMGISKDKGLHVGDIMLISTTNVYLHTSLSIDTAYIPLVDCIFQYLRQKSQYKHIELLHTTLSPFVKQYIYAYIYVCLLTVATTTGYIAHSPGIYVKLGNSQEFRGNFSQLFPPVLSECISDLSVAISGMARESGLQPVFFQTYTSNGHMIALSTNSTSAAMAAPQDSRSGGDNGGDIASPRIQTATSTSTSTSVSTTSTSPSCISSPFSSYSRLPPASPASTIHPHPEFPIPESKIPGLGLPQWYIPITSESLYTSTILLQTHHEYLLRQYTTNRAISSCYLMLSHERERREVLVRRETERLYTQMKEEEKKRILAETKAIEVRQRCEEWLEQTRQDRKDERRKLLLMYEERLSKEAARVRCIVEANEAMMVACEKVVKDIEKNRDDREEEIRQILQNERQLFQNMIKEQEQKHKREQQIVLQYITDECQDVELSLINEKIQLENTEKYYKKKVVDLEMEDKVSHSRLVQITTKMRELDTQLSLEKQKNEKLREEKSQLETSLRKEEESHGKTQLSCASLERELHTLLREKDILTKEVSILNGEVTDTVSKLLHFINKSAQPPSTHLSPADLELLQAQAQIVRLRERVRDSEAKERALRSLLMQRGVVGGSGSANMNGVHASSVDINTLITKISHRKREISSEKDRELVTQLVSHIRKQEEVISFFRNQVLKQKQTNNLDRSQRLLMATKAAEELRATRELLLMTRKEKKAIENELLVTKGLATSNIHENRIGAMAAEARNHSPARLTGNGILKAAMKAPLPPAAKGKNIGVSRTSTGRSGVDVKKGGTSGKVKEHWDLYQISGNIVHHHTKDEEEDEEYDVYSTGNIGKNREISDYIRTSGKSNSAGKSPDIPDEDDNFDFEDFLANAQITAEQEADKSSPDSTSSQISSKTNGVGLHWMKSMLAREQQQQQSHSAHLSSGMPSSASPAMSSAIASSTSSSMARTRPSTAHITRTHISTVQRTQPPAATASAATTTKATTSGSRASSLPDNATIHTLSSLVHNEQIRKDGKNPDSRDISEKIAANTRKIPVRPSSAFISREATYPASTSRAPQIPVPGSGPALGSIATSGWSVRKEVGKEDSVLYNWTGSSEKDRIPENGNNLRLGNIGFSQNGSRSVSEKQALLSQTTSPLTLSTTTSTQRKSVLTKSDENRKSEKLQKSEISGKLSREDRRKLGIDAANVALISSLDATVTSVLHARRGEAQEEEERAKARALLRELRIDHGERGSGFGYGDGERTSDRGTIVGTGASAGGMGADGKVPGKRVGWSHDVDATQTHITVSSNSNTGIHSSSSSENESSHGFTHAPSSVGTVFGVNLKSRYHGKMSGWAAENGQDADE